MAKRGRKKRIITPEEREAYLKIRREFGTEKEAIEKTGIVKLLWQNLRAQDEEFRKQCENLNARHESQPIPILKDFDLQAELKALEPYIFYWLKDEAENGKGTSRVGSIIELRKWIELKGAAKNDMPVLKIVRPNTELLGT